MNRMKNLFTLLTLLLWTLVACSNDSAADEKPGSGGTDIPAGNLPMQNVARAIELIDNAVECYFTGTGMAMSRYYNPYTGNRSSELGSVWMYTSSIEAVNAAMKAMKTGQAKGETALYDSHFNRYKELLTQLYDNLEYYAGTFTLTSYTQTKQWTVYGVNRGNDKGAAQVEGILNVYDDQMWLVRELLESYHITGEQRYLEKAEYLMEYVLDGWDCTLDEQGNPLGGITWGPGYLTKHSCSNGPIVSPLVWLHEIYKGKFSQYGINPDRRTPSGIRAAIIREKGTNGEREMAYSLYLAGFDVKDVTMTDLISGRETLEDVNMIVYCGGFSNSDVLGSAKGWAGAFLFNPKAKEALDKYYAREDTLSLGVCNGCQLMMELNLINPEHKKNGKMLHNDSHKFESRFLGVTVPTNRSVMLGSLSGSKLGIWVAHGEGKFSLPYDEDKYNVVLKYSYDEYPSNPNGSDYSIAGLASADGRHLAMMPHLERAIFPWQNGCYPADRVNSDQITPWVEAFVNARKWVEANKK